MAGVFDLHLGDELLTVEAPPASREELARVHTSNYLDELEDFCLRGGGNLDADTFAGSDSWTAASRAAGAGLATIEALHQHDQAVGFVAARPPGHHATADRAMGFCLLNNVAVAAASLTAQGDRVLIVDWDVHHGNGTQSIFWDDPNVLYVSTHQWPLYPGTGKAAEIGGSAARGLTVNIPVPPGATGDIIRMALHEVGRPAIRAVRPGLGADLMRLRRSSRGPAGGTCAFGWRLGLVGPTCGPVLAAARTPRVVPRGWLRPDCPSDFSHRHLERTSRGFRLDRTADEGWAGT